MEQYNYKGESYETLDNLFKVNIQEAQVSLDVFKEKVKKGVKPERAIKNTNVLKSPLFIISAWTLICFIMAIVGLNIEYFNNIGEFLHTESDQRGYIFFKDFVLFFLPDSFFEYFDTVIVNNIGYVTMWFMGIFLYMVSLAIYDEK